MILTRSGAPGLCRTSNKVLGNDLVSLGEDRPIFPTISPSTLLFHQSLILFVTLRPSCLPQSMFLPCLYEPCLEGHPTHCNLKQLRNLFARLVCLAPGLLPSSSLSLSSSSILCLAFSILCLVSLLLSATCHSLPSSPRLFLASSTPFAGIIISPFTFLPTSALNAFPSVIPTLRALFSERVCGDALRTTLLVPRDCWGGGERGRRLKAHSSFCTRSPLFSRGTSDGALLELGISFDYNLSVAFVLM